MTTKLNHPIWEFISDKSEKNVYFPSGRFVTTMPDGNGIVQTSFYDDVIIGKSIFGYNRNIDQFYANRGKRFAHSAREPSLYSYGNNAVHFTTSYQSAFSPHKLNVTPGKSDKSADRNYKHHSFTDNRAVTHDNLFTCYSTDYFDKCEKATNCQRKANKNKMISSESLQAHMKDSRYNYPQTSTAYRETINQLGEERLSNYRSSMIPIIPADTGNRFHNFRRVSGNVILSKLRQTNQPLIS